MRKQDFLERVIRRFIPPPILYVCEAEESGWFAEIGRVAVIFVNIAIKGLPGMDVMQSVYLVSGTFLFFFRRSLSRPISLSRSVKLHFRCMLPGNDTRGKKPTAPPGSCSLLFHADPGTAPQKRITGFLPPYRWLLLNDVFLRGIR